MPGLHLIALDKSGSMRQGRELARDDVYAAGLSGQDTHANGLVALLCFCCQGVELLLPPGQARAAGSARVQPVSGGGTPLSVCLQQADRILLATTLQRVPDQDTCLWLFTGDYTFEQLGPA
ncbi:hypothetical protein [Hydrogenophaga sp.]|uniref:hypothetical protein n=1 Tax=Hydrogenophaga sp. TaxID=1904254 RepID=UPI002720414D|nr:hypothetical protein [Hydrogenophaga sp.]MDO9505887.1 hypothetical protein [Hydrogenophaga sp.]